MRTLSILAIAITVAGCATHGGTRPFKLAAGPATAPAGEHGAPTTGPANPAYAEVAKVLKAGDLREEVYTITYGRNDVTVTAEMGDLPPLAWASQFQFFMCPCGRTNVVGQFTVLDFEAGDVLDELREGQMRIVSVGPAFVGERPRLTMVRFQGEGSAEALATTIKKCFQWVGEERMKPQKPAAVP